jgi:hypothetical protein
MKLPVIVIFFLLILSNTLCFLCKATGEGKTTYTFSVSMNVLSANIPFCMVPAGGEGGSGRKGTEIRWR